MGDDGLWQPLSGCDGRCLPPPGATPMVSGLVQAGRALAVLGMLVFGAFLLPTLPLLPARQRGTAGRAWAVGLLRAFGVRLRVRGRPPVRRALLVSNHISWLDILVLLAVSPARLLAKHEVRAWPLIGWLAAAGGTVFIDRSRPKRLPATVAAVAAALRAGGVVAVFPEGTTWCGNATGRFRPAMFQAAIDAGAVVAPLRLRYRLRGGGPGPAHHWLSDRPTTAVGFLGEETLLTSVRRVLRLRGLVVAVTAGPALHPGPTATRRLLARAAESTVGGPAVTLPGGRPGHYTPEVYPAELDLAA